MTQSSRCRRRGTALLSGLVLTTAAALLLPAQALASTPVLVWKDASVRQVDDFAASGPYRVVLMERNPGEIWASDSSNSGASWSTPVRLANDFAKWGLSAQVVIAGNQALAVWEEGAGSNTGSVDYMAVMTFGQAWGSPVQVSDSAAGTTAFMPAIAANGYGTIVSWNERTASFQCPCKARVRLYDRGLGQWLQSQTLGNTQFRVAVAATSTRLGAAWSTPAHKVKFINADGAAGLGWSAIKNIGDGDWPFLATTDTAARIVFAHGNKIRFSSYTYSNGSSTPAATAVQNANYALNDVAATGSKIAITYDGDIVCCDGSGNGYVVTSSNSGGSWTKTKIHTFAASTSQVAYLATGVLAEVWFSQGNLNKVWYKTY